ncbi:MAG: peptide chain release factor N(5)-glutamine methyltransferase [Solirubrobacterales bacterium]
MTIGNLLVQGYKILKEAGIESYQLDAQLLLGKVLNKDRIYVLTNREKEEGQQQAEDYFKLIDLRKNNMPVKYILGECEFLGRNFIVREGVLIPRPDTEVLVETAISYIREKEYRKICDVCSGSGIIGLTIAAECVDTEVICLDISPVAVSVTNENISALELEQMAVVHSSNLLEYPLKENIKFDAIISNPPYIKSEEIPNLMEDVKNYEPHLALSGGEDGLDFYREITKQSNLVLNSGGMLAFEIGWDQDEAVRNILKENKFINICSFKDLAEKDRVVLGFKNNI